MGQDVKFVHLLSNTHKRTACFQPQDKCFHIYIFHFLCVCTQKRVNDLLLYIYTLYDPVTLDVLLADTRSNEHDIEQCILQEYKPKGKITTIIAIMTHNIGKYLIVGVNPSICNLHTRWRSAVSFELWGTFVPWGKSALDN